MRNANGLLLATMVIAFAAFGAPAALAQSIEISQEDVTHCGPVAEHAIQVGPIEGGCLIHATTEPTKKLEVRKHVFGIESHVGACDLELYGRLDENGEGYAFEQTYSGAGCTRQACATAAGIKEHWRAHAREGAGQEGREWITVNFCVEPNGGGANESCEIDLPFQTYENQHRAELGHATETGSHGVSGFRCEMLVHLNTEIAPIGPHGVEQEGVVTHLTP